MLSQSSLKTILEKIDHAVIIADTSGNFVHWNTAAEKILGLPHDKKEVEKWSEFFKITKPDGVMYNHDDLPIMRATRGESVHKEQLYLTGDGPGKYLEVESFPLIDSNGVILGAAAAFKDISDHKKMQRFADELWLALEGMKKLLNNNFFS